MTQGRDPRSRPAVPSASHLRGTSRGRPCSCTRGGGGAREALERPPPHLISTLHVDDQSATLFIIDCHFNCILICINCGSIRSFQTNYGLFRSFRIVPELFIYMCSTMLFNVPPQQHTLQPMLSHFWRHCLLLNLNIVFLLVYPVCSSYVPCSLRGWMALFRSS